MRSRSRVSISSRVPSVEPSSTTMISLCGTGERRTASIDALERRDLVVAGDHHRESQRREISHADPLRRRVAPARAGPVTSLTPLDLLLRDGHFGHLPSALQLVVGRRLHLAPRSRWRTAARGHSVPRCPPPRSLSAEAYSLVAENPAVPKWSPTSSRASGSCVAVLRVARPRAKRASSPAGSVDRGFVGYAVSPIVARG